MPTLTDSIYRQIHVLNSIYCNRKNDILSRMCLSSSSFAVGLWLSRLSTKATKVKHPDQKNRYQFKNVSTVALLLFDGSQINQQVSKLSQ